MSKIKQSYFYSTSVDEKGNVRRLRHWWEYFTDESTGEKVKIKRSRMIKLNGVKITWYSNSEIKKMTPKERNEISLTPILNP